MNIIGLGGKGFIVVFTIAFLNTVFSFSQCILTDKVNKVLYRSTDLANFTRKKVQFVPSFITFHPRDRNYAMAYDSSSEKVCLTSLYMSSPFYCESFFIQSNLLVQPPAHRTNFFVFLNLSLVNNHI